MKIKVVVRTNSSREEVIYNEDGTYKVFLKKPAIENKANHELIKVLKKYFGTDVEILKGHTSKNKMVNINNGN